MAIAVTSPQAIKSGFIKNATSADASGTEEIIAAPGAGISHNIEYLVISSDSAISITIDDNIALGKELGIEVTPTLILPSGSMLPGYLTADKLIEVIEEGK